MSQGMNRKQVWAAVFDGAQAALYRVAHPGETGPGLEMIEEFSQVVPPAREHGRDRPGRTHTPGGGRAAMETPDRRRRAEEAFVRQFARETARRAAGDQFDELVVLASADKARVFRGALGAAEDRIVAERDGDFVNHSKLALEDAVAEAQDQARFER